MARLSSDQLLNDDNSVGCLKLNHKALSDVRQVVLFRTSFSLFPPLKALSFLDMNWQVSCLRDFKNLERLDLSFNKLTSLEVHFRSPILFSLKKFWFLFFMCKHQIMRNLFYYVIVKWTMYFVNQGLKSCINLKWLSVAQNKLESLKGIESLSKLTVSIPTLFALLLFPFFEYFYNCLGSL